MEEAAKKKRGYNQRKNEYTQKYIRENYKQLSLRVPTSGDLTRDDIARAAQEQGESVNAYILQAVRERMEWERAAERG